SSRRYFRRQSRSSSYSSSSGRSCQRGTGSPASSRSVKNCPPADDGPGAGRVESVKPVAGSGGAPGSSGTENSAAHLGPRAVLPGDSPSPGRGGAPPPGRKGTDMSRTLGRATAANG